MSDQPTDAPVTLTRAELRAQRAAGAGEDPVGAGDPAPEVPVIDAALWAEAEGHIVDADWRIAQRTAKGWNEWLLAGALISLGLAVIGGALITGLWPSPWAAAASTIVLWIGMLVPIVGAFSRDRPTGLLRLRALDLLYGVVLGVGLRLIQGWAAIAAGGSGALPSYPLIDGELPTGWWITDGLGAAVVAPVIEEFYFRGVLLVAFFLVLHRATGRIVAGLVALLVTTGLFVLVHGLTLDLPVDRAVAIVALAVTCGLLVLLTGRIWGAVLVHVVFNSTYVVLALTGAFLG